MEKYESVRPIAPKGIILSAMRDYLPFELSYKIMNRIMRELEKHGAIIIWGEDKCE